MSDAEQTSQINSLGRVFPSRRYFIVVALARVADWTLLISVPYYLGTEYVFIGWAAGLFVDCLIEFFGHKLFTYAHVPNGSWWQSFLEFSAYLGNRFGLGSIAAVGAWFIFGGEVGPSMAVFYVATSLLTWFIFQVQVNRIIFQWRKALLYLRGKR